MSGVSKKTPLPHWQKVMDKAGWETATEMAKKSHVPVSSVHDVVYGRSQGSPEMIFKIARAARIDPGVLLADIVKYADKLTRRRDTLAS